MVVKTPGVGVLLIACAVFAIAIVASIIVLAIFESQLKSCKSTQSTQCFNFVCPDATAAIRDKSCLV